MQQEIKESTVEAALSGRQPRTPFHHVVATLSPAYFALVMATGILAVACRLQEIPVLPEILLPINLVAYAVLWGLTILRLLYYPQRFIADFCSHQRGAGFLPPLPPLRCWAPNWWWK